MNTFDPFTIFVDSLGIDDYGCGNISNPCGTIAFATALSMYSETFTNISKIDLYITGQNEEEVYAWDSNNKTHTDVFLDEYELRSPCRMYIEFDKDIELTFDSAKIHSMKDWFPDACEQTWR
eukprot:601085_1